MEYKGNHRRTFEYHSKSGSLTKHSPNVLTLFACVLLPEGAPFGLFLIVGGKSSMFHLARQAK
jgi:hypothetical protein